MKVFVKRYPEKGEFPEKNGWYLGSGAIHQYSVDNGFYDIVKWWLEEIELPSEGEIENMAEEMAFPNSVKFGANYILNLLKQR